MASKYTATLSKLSDIGQVVANADEDIRGRKVKDKDGNDLGKVDDLLIDDHYHKVRFLQVEHGGLLGVGRTRPFVPIDAITQITDDVIAISHSRDDVAAAAPPYDPEIVDADKPDYYNNLYDHYDHSAFWERGYVYPRWPSYYM